MLLGNCPWRSSAYLVITSSPNMETEKDLSQESAGLMQHTWLSWDGWSCYTVAQCGLYSGCTDLNELEMLNYVTYQFLGR